MNKQANYLRFDTVDEFWREISGHDLVFVVFEDAPLSGQKFLDAVGTLEHGETSFLVSAATLSGRARDYFLIYSPIDRRVNIKFQGEIPLPYVLASIPGMGHITSTSEIVEIESVLEYSRRELQVFNNMKRKFLPP